MNLAFVGYNYANLRGCYAPQPSTSVDNTLLDLHNSSYPTQPHSLTANKINPMLSKYCNYRRLLKIKNKLKIGCLINKVRKNSRYFVGVFNKTIIPLTLDMR